jgi:hypothetical protein
MRAGLDEKTAAEYASARQTANRIAGPAALRCHTGGPGQGQGRFNLIELMGVRFIP